MSRHVTTMTIYDAEHYTDAQRAAIIASYPAHERDARTKGVPALGSGRVFPFPDEQVMIEPLQVPPHWPQLAAIDFGWDHPTAAVRIAWDRDDDVVYLTHCYRVRQATPLIHSGALRPWGDWLPWAWPHDGMSHGPRGDEPLADIYRRHGMTFLPEKAAFPDGGRSVEAGVMELVERVETSRLRVFNTCCDWFEEYRLYHRKDGKIVEEHDDLIDATRYAIMCLDKAKTKPRARDRIVERPRWVI